MLTLPRPLSCLTFGRRGLLYTSSLDLSLGGQEDNTVPLAIKLYHTPVSPCVTAEDVIIQHLTVS